MYIIFDIDGAISNEIQEIEIILKNNKIEYYTHDDLTWTSFAQRYLWVKDRNSYIKARQLIEDYYESSQEFNIFTDKEHDTTKKWYFILMALFVLIYLVIILLAKYFN